VKYNWFEARLVCHPEHSEGSGGSGGSFPNFPQILRSLRSLRILMFVITNTTEYENMPVGAGLDPADGRPQGSPLHFHFHNNDTLGQSVETELNLILHT
jgi:hypothetical protein